jgi:hypothetical protein
MYRDGSKGYVPEFRIDRIKAVGDVGKKEGQRDSVTRCGLQGCFFCGLPCLLRCVPYAARGSPGSKEGGKGEGEDFVGTVAHKDPVRAG